MLDLTLISHKGNMYIDSREVAELIGKQHKHLLRDIRGYSETIEKCGQTNFGLSDFFVESSFLNRQNKEMPCYLISKMGCEMVANKLTGEKGILFTAVYVRKFNTMENVKHAIFESKSVMPTPRLGEYNAAARLIIRTLQNSGVTSEQIVEFIRKFYEPLGIIVFDDLKMNRISRLYTPTQIAKLIGIYSIYGNPHNQAIACILNEIIFIDEKHKTIVTTYYGNHMAISVRYDEQAVQAIREWLLDNNYPNRIYGFEKTYYALYRTHEK